MNKNKMLCPLFILFGMVVSTPSAVESDTKELSKGTQTDSYPIQQALNIISTMRRKGDTYPLQPGQWIVPEEVMFCISFQGALPIRLLKQIPEQADRLLEKANLGNEIITEIREIKEKVQERFSYISCGYDNFNFDNDSNISGIPTESTSDFFDALITSKIKGNTDEGVQRFVKELQKLGIKEQYLANRIVEDYRDYKYKL